MGISSGPPPDDPKPKIVMGYPSMDRYHHQSQQQQQQQTYPPAPPSAYPAPHHPTGYAMSASLSSSPQPHHYNHHQAYASSSSQPSSSFPQNNGKYVNPGPPNPYPPPQPYINDYYYQQHYKPLVPDPGSNSSFGRVMLILMIVLVASMCMMSLVMWFLFGTYIPEFEVVSLKVENFTATDTTLTGKWDVELSVSNTNKDLAVHFDRVMSSIFYREALLGISTLQPFQVDQMHQSLINFSMPAEQTPNDQKLQGWVLPTLAQDRSNGMVVFSLRLAMKTNFTTNNVVYRQESLRVMCENIQVIFSPTGEGTLSPGLGSMCLIRLRESEQVSSLLHVILSLNNLIHLTFLIVEIYIYIW